MLLLDLPDYIHIRVPVNSLFIWNNNLILCTTLQKIVWTKKKITFLPIWVLVLNLHWHFLWISGGYFNSWFEIQHRGSSRHTMTFSPGDLKVNFKGVTWYHRKYKKTEWKDVQKAPGNLFILATHLSCIKYSSVGKISTYISFTMTYLFVENIAHLIFKKNRQKSKHRTNFCQKFPYWSSKLRFFWKPSRCFLAISMRLKKSRNSIRLFNCCIFHCM